MAGRGTAAGAPRTTNAPGGPTTRARSGRAASECRARRAGRKSGSERVEVRRRVGRVEVIRARWPTSRPARRSQRTRRLVPARRLSSWMGNGRTSWLGNRLAAETTGGTARRAGSEEETTSPPRMQHRSRQWRGASCIAYRGVLLSVVHLEQYMGQKTIVYANQEYSATTPACASSTPLPRRTVSTPDAHASPCPRRSS